MDECGDRRRQREWLLPCVAVGVRCRVWLRYQVWMSDGGGEEDLHYQEVAALMFLVSETLA